MPEAPYCQGPGWKPRASTEVEGACGACGAALVGRNHWFCPSPYGTQYSGESCRNRYAINHWWGEARVAALRRDGFHCVRAECDGGNGQYSGHGLEVNHVTPREGQGYGNGCHNHQDNLESLCHAHHLVTTAEQRGHVAGGEDPRVARKRRQTARDLEKLRRWEAAAAG